MDGRFEYTELEMEVLSFDSKDVIVTSNEGDIAGNG